jgi:hypothetical protein
MVPGRPDGQRRRGDRRQLGRRPGHARRQVRPVPVQRCGQRSRPGQVRDGLVEVPRAAGERAQPGPVIVLDGRLRDPVELEEQRVPGHLVLPQGGRRERVRHRDSGQRADPVRAHDGREPGHSRAPVVPHHVRSRHAQLVQERADVADHIPQRVGADLGRAFRAPETAQVRGDDPVSAGGQGRHLVPPQPGRVRPAVQQQDGVAVTVFLDVEGDAVRLDDPAVVLAGHAPDHGTRPGGWRSRFAGVTRPGTAAAGRRPASRRPPTRPARRGPARG